MRQITFPDGARMPWPTYRDMMNGRISPQAAVARMRRVTGALDAALPRRHARDQNGGRLSRTYCDATEKFLGDNGVDPDDVAGIMKVLSQYVEEPAPAEDEENLEMPEEKRVPVGGPRGPVGAQDRRRMALDQFDEFGQPRSLSARPLPTGASRGFAGRFPEADKIRVL